ncbi:histidine kinase famiy protein [Sphingomonas sp. ID0503]|uniref:histidine kinase famiy protein n=1 Tax=Sphingomonas sp. ID0503 TaxID=3399691 RepID=UPI003AFAC5D1
MQQDEDSPRDVEGGGQISGTPAEGSMDVGGREPLGSSRGMHHWRQSTITETGLDDRGNVFFAAIEMTRMPMVLTDPNQPDNPIVFANKAFLDLTGYEEEEILGRNCRFLQGAQSDREAVAELREAVKSGGSIAIEILNYKRDGTPFWNAVFIGPVHDTDGKLVYQFASQLDVTRRRESELSYRQAQKMEAIGQLTAGLAHDFNNLLQAVTGNLEMLESVVQDERGRRYVERARTAADRGAKLTRQLLAFARKTRLEPRPVDLSNLVNEFLDVIESALGKQIDLHLSLRRRLPRVMIDPEQLEMALLNTLVNARDAMPGGGTVTISTLPLHLNGDAAARNLPSGDYVVLEIRDDGEGMPAHVRDRAIEPFFTTKREGKGTGLGLAMASGFAQQSRGRMEIDSAPGAGTTIRFLFPVSHLQADESEPPKLHHRPPEARDGQRGAEHILVVEDSAEVLDLATEILTAAGYQVTIASSGEEGLRLFQENPQSFDLLFTDLVMPGGINGLVLAEEVGRIAPELPVLMTTGYNEELVADGPARPANDVLGKPYRRSELLDRVREAINRTGRDPARRRPSDYGAAQA